MGTVTNETRERVRYFARFHDGRPVAVIRLLVDPVRRRIVDQTWNPTSDTWTDGDHGIHHLTHGDHDVEETSEAGILDLFPSCPTRHDTGAASGNQETGEGTTAP